MLNCRPRSVHVPNHICAHYLVTESAKARPAANDLVEDTFGQNVIAPGRNKTGLPASSISTEEVTDAQPKIAYRPSDEHTDKHMAIGFDIHVIFLFGIPGLSGPVHVFRFVCACRLTQSRSTLMEMTVYP